MVTLLQVRLLHTIVCGVTTFDGNIWTMTQSLFDHAQRSILTGKHELITLTYNMKRSNYFVERFHYFVERSDLEQSDLGTK